MSDRTDLPSTDWGPRACYLTSWTLGFLIGHGIDTYGLLCGCRVREQEFCLVTPGQTYRIQASVSHCSEKGRASRVRAPAARWDPGAHCRPQGATLLFPPPNPTPPRAPGPPPAGRAAPCRVGWGSAPQRGHLLRPGHISPPPPATPSAVPARGPRTPLLPRRPAEHCTHIRGWVLL